LRDKYHTARQIASSPSLTSKPHNFPHPSVWKPVLGYAASGDGHIVESQKYRGKKSLMGMTAWQANSTSKTPFIIDN
jgi:hypothetical protein